MTEENHKADEELDELIRGLQVYHHNGEVASAAVVIVDKNGNVGMTWAGDPRAHYSLIGGVTILQRMLCQAFDHIKVQVEPKPKLEPIPGRPNVVPLRREAGEEE